MESLVEWLADVNEQLDIGVDSALHLLADEKAIETLLTALDSPILESDLLEKICDVAVRLYRIGREVKPVAIQFIPSLISAYLCGMRRRETANTLSTALLAIYNLQIVDETGNLKSEVVRIPNLGNYSIYHDPANLSSLGLFENVLGMRPGTQPVVVPLGPFPAVVKLTAHNRFLVLTALLHHYNDYIGKVASVAVMEVCRITSKLCRSGFHFPGFDLVHRVLGPVESSRRKEKKNSQLAAVFSVMDDYSCLPRIQVCSLFLLELLNAVYYAIFNNYSVLGLQALDDIHHRSGFEVYPDVLLATNAVINSLLENPSGVPADGPMGLQFTEMVRIPSQKGLVTNASIRYRRLPEDILPKAVDSAKQTNGDESESQSSLMSSPQSAKSRLLDPKLLNLNLTAVNGGSPVAAGTASTMKQSASAIDVKSYVDQLKLAELKKNSRLGTSDSSDSAGEMDVTSPLIINGNGTAAGEAPTPTWDFGTSPSSTTAVVVEEIYLQELNSSDTEKFL